MGPEQYTAAIKRRRNSALSRDVNNLVYRKMSARTEEILYLWVFDVFSPLDPIGNQLEMLCFVVKEQISGQLYR